MSDTPFDNENKEEKIVPPGSIPEKLLKPGKIVQPAPGKPLMEVQENGSLGPISAPSDNGSLPDPDGGDACCQGFNKHYGRAVAYIEFGAGASNDPFSTSMRSYWWESCTINSSVTLKENTDPDSSVVQYQPVLRQGLMIDFTSTVPKVGAAAYTTDLREGIEIQGIRFAPRVQTSNLLEGSRLMDSTDSASWFTGHGPFFIESCNVSASQGDWTNVKLSIKGSGYNACSIPSDINIDLILDAYYSGPDHTIDYSASTDFSELDGGNVAA